MNGGPWFLMLCRPSFLFLPLPSPSFPLSLRLPLTTMAFFSNIYARSELLNDDDTPLRIDEVVPTLAETAWEQPCTPEDVQQLLVILEEMLGTQASPPPFLDILHHTNKPWFPRLAALSDKDLSNLIHCLEFLQLPRELYNTHIHYELLQRFMSKDPSESEHFYSFMDPYIRSKDWMDCADRFCLSYVLKELQRAGGSQQLMDYMHRVDYTVGRMTRFRKIAREPFTKPVRPYSERSYLHYDPAYWDRREVWVILDTPPEDERYTDDEVVLAIRNNHTSRVSYVLNFMKFTTLTYEHLLSAAVWSRSIPMLRQITEWIENSYEPNKCRRIFDKGAFLRFLEDADMDECRYLFEDIAPRFQPSLVEKTVDAAMCQTYMLGWVVQSGRQDVLHYLHETLGLHVVLQELQVAAEHGHLAILRYLHETLSAPLHHTLFGAVVCSTHPSTDIVDYLVARECPLDVNIVKTCCYSNKPRHLCILLDRTHLRTLLPNRIHQRRGEEWTDTVWEFLYGCRLY